MMNKKVKKFSKDITRSRISRDLVFYIRLTRIILVITPLMLNAQDIFSPQQYQLSEGEKWRLLNEYTENAVKKGHITREEADRKYSRFRFQSRTKKEERKDPVLEEHFRKLGVYNIKQLENHLIDKNIPVDKLDAVLGGMLRLVHNLKSQNNNSKMSPRLKSYFKKRLGLSKYQIRQIYKTARDISLGRFK